MESLSTAFKWVAGGLASCVAAHALMIPLGLEQWLHTTFGAVTTGTALTPNQPIMDLT